MVCRSTRMYMMQHCGVLLHHLVKNRLPINQDHLMCLILREETGKQINRLTLLCREGPQQRCGMRGSLTIKRNECSPKESFGQYSIFNAQCSAFDRFEN